MARKKVTLSGEEPKTTDTPAPDMETKADGQHKDYWVLSDEDRSNGFVRPYRDVYTHKTCGFTTHMGMKLAETFAADNTFYTHTFCCTCGQHLPVNEFVWIGTNEEVGS